MDDECIPHFMKGIKTKPAEFEIIEEYKNQDRQITSNYITNNIHKLTKIDKIRILKYLVDLSKKSKVKISEHADGCRVNLNLLDINDINKIFGYIYNYQNNLHPNIRIQ